jgi:2-hydroxychromene-2-carboxylate isomerase
VLAEVATSAGLDADAFAAEVASGRPLKVLADEHTEASRRWHVFGVPTFIVGERAVFVRVMDRKNPDDVDRVLDLLEWTDLNEFKHTSVPR